jgi:hypothetical protein
MVVRSKESCRTTTRKRYIAIALFGFWGALGGAGSREKLEFLERKKS